jgi:hypothetical protein
VPCRPGRLIHAASPRTPTGIHDAVHHHPPAVLRPAGQRATAHRRAGSGPAARAADSRAGATGAKHGGAVRRRASGSRTGMHAPLVRPNARTPTPGSSEFGSLRLRCPRHFRARRAHPAGRIGAVAIAARLRRQDRSFLALPVRYFAALGEGSGRSPAGIGDSGVIGQDDAHAFRAWSAPVRWGAVAC